MARAMQTKTTHAGGCFLMIAILLGFLGGVSMRNPLGGTLIGLGVGIAIAVVVWLIDRRRG
jgi:hypothetical protein